MTKQFTLGKNERLKSRKQIELLFSKGRKFTITPFRVYYLFSQLTNSPLQFGVGVSNKNFKKAVDRNKIKRLVREVYRLQYLFLKQKLKGKRNQLSIFFIYTGKELPEYNILFEQINKILHKFDHIADSEN